jgi:hypothetical protein
LPVSRAPECAGRPKRSFPRFALVNKGRRALPVGRSPFSQKTLPLCKAFRWYFPPLDLECPAFPIFAAFCPSLVENRLDIPAAAGRSQPDPFWQLLFLSRGLHGSRHRRSAQRR